MVRTTTTSGRSSNTSSNNNHNSGTASSMARDAAAAATQGSLSAWNSNTSNSNSKHGHHKNSAHHSSAAANGGGTGASAGDPTFLLSRGYTSRFLLGNSSGNVTNGNGNGGGMNKMGNDSSTSFSLLQALTPEDVDKDVRHMQAYGAAVLQYQQQYYWHTNQAAGRPVTVRPVMTDVGLTSDVTGSAGVPASSTSGPGAGGAAGSGGALPGTAPPPAVAIITQLPVRIDPEEEKRLQVLRTKIQKAEVLREQAEQEYVAYRAHYVGQQHCLVQQTVQSKAVLTWLQALTEKRAAVVALQRVRLEMTRNVNAALHVRASVLQEPPVVDAAAAAGGSGGDGDGLGVAADAVPGSNMELNSNNNNNNVSSTAATNSSSTSNNPSLLTVTPVAAHATRSTDVDEMLTVWNQIEDDFKASVIACRQISSSPVAGTGTGSGTGKNNKKKDAALPWKATKLTATPTNVPLLLSAVSTVPEKSLAWKCSGVFGSKPDSLAWMESHLPDPDPIPVTTTSTVMMDLAAAAQKLKATNTTNNTAAAIDNTDTNQVEALREELEFIGRELDKERDSSKSYAHKIAQLRTQNDEWVAMMGLVRQETESVLHRHHILLESDMAMQASERLHHEHEEERIADETAAAQKEEAAEPQSQSLNHQPLAPQGDNGEEEEGEVKPLQAPGANAEDAGVPTVVVGVDEANDGDDEDSNDDDDEELLGNTADWETGKRPAPADDAEDTSPAERKRRKL